MMRTIQTMRLIFAAYNDTSTGAHTWIFRLSSRTAYKRIPVVAGTDQDDCGPVFLHLAKKNTRRKIFLEDY